MFITPFICRFLFCLRTKSQLNLSRYARKIYATVEIHLYKEKTKQQNLTKRPIGSLFRRGHRIESTKCVPLLAFIIGLYCIFHICDPNEILMKCIVAFCPIRVFCRKRIQLRYCLSFKDYIWLIHPFKTIDKSKG